MDLTKEFKVFKQKLEKADAGLFSFYVAFLLSIVLTLVGAYLSLLVFYFLLLLVVLGLLIGWLNVKKTSDFILASLGLVLVKGTSLLYFDTLLPPLGSYLNLFVGYLLVWITPALLLVCLRSVFDAVRQKT